MENKCLQIVDGDCGFACLKMMLSYYHKDKNYLYLPQDLNKNNYSFLEIIDIAKKYNLFLKGYEIVDLTLLRSFPCIAQIKENNKYHFVIVEKIKKGYVYLYDPKLKERVLTLENYKSISMNNYLLFSNVDKINNRFKRSINTSIYDLLSIIVLLFQMFSLFILSFNVESFNFNILIGGLIFIFSYISIKIINIITLKHFDNNYIYKIIDKLKDKDSKYIKSLYELKSLIFLNKQNSILLGLLISLSVFILLINDYKNIISLIIIISLIFIKNMILKLFLLPIKEKINQCELSDNNYLSNYKKADKLSYKYSILYLIINSGIFIIMCLCSIIISIINNNFSPLIIYICLYQIVVDHLEKLINKNDDEIKKRECIYYSLLELYK